MEVEWKNDRYGEEKNRPLYSFRQAWDQLVLQGGIQVHV